MNRFVFLCYVREDQGPVSKSLAQAMAALGMKVVYRVISPWPANEEPRGILREEIQTGLNECCYGVIFLSEAFLSRDWPLAELSEIVSRIVDGEERLIHVRFAVSDKDLAEFYPPLAATQSILCDGDYSKTASAILERLAEDEDNEKQLGQSLAHVGLNRRSLRLFACHECASQEDLTLECLTAPPLGARGMLVCPSCGRGYPIRGDIVHLLGEGACNPDEPRPRDLQPPPEI